jgi:hypothetical protein
MGDQADPTVASRAGHLQAVAVRFAERRSWARTQASFYVRFEAIRYVRRFSWCLQEVAEWEMQSFPFCGKQRLVEIAMNRPIPNSQSMRSRKFRILNSPSGAADNPRRL